MSLVMDSLEPNNLRLVLDGGNVVASILREAKDSGAFLRAMGRSLLSRSARSERATRSPSSIVPRSRPSSVGRRPRFAAHASRSSRRAEAARSRRFAACAARSTRRA